MSFNFLQKVLQDRQDFLLTSRNLRTSFKFQNFQNFRTSGRPAHCSVSIFVILFFFQTSLNQIFWGFLQYKDQPWNNNIYIADHSLGTRPQHSLGNLCSVSSHSTQTSTFIYLMTETTLRTDERYRLNSTADSIQCVEEVMTTDI